MRRCKHGCFRCSRLQMLFKIFTGKHLCWSIIFIKRLKTRNFTEEDSNTGAYCEMFENSLFYRTTPVAASGASLKPVLHIIRVQWKKGMTNQRF